MLFPESCLLSPGSWVICVLLCGMLVTLERVHA